MLSIGTVNTQSLTTTRTFLKPIYAWIKKFLYKSLYLVLWAMCCGVIVPCKDDDIIEDNILDANGEHNPIKNSTNAHCGSFPDNCSDGNCIYSENDGKEKHRKLLIGETQQSESLNLTTKNKIYTSIINSRKPTYENTKAYKHKLKKLISRTSNIPTTDDKVVKYPMIMNTSISPNTFKDDQRNLKRSNSMVSKLPNKYVILSDPKTEDMSIIAILASYSNLYADDTPSIAPGAVPLNKPPHLHKKKSRSPISRKKGRVSLQENQIGSDVGVRKIRTRSLSSFICRYSRLESRDPFRYSRENSPTIESSPMQVHQSLPNLVPYSSFMPRTKRSRLAKLREISLIEMGGRIYRKHLSISKKTTMFHNTSSRVKVLHSFSRKSRSANCRMDIDTNQNMLDVSHSTKMNESKAMYSSVKANTSINQYPPMYIISTDRKRRETSLGEGCTTKSRRNASFNRIPYTHYPAGITRTSGTLISSGTKRDNVWIGDEENKECEDAKVPKKMLIHCDNANMISNA